MVTILIEVALVASHLAVMFGAYYLSRAMHVGGEYLQKQRSLKTKLTMAENKIYQLRSELRDADERASVASPALPLSPDLCRTIVAMGTYVTQRLPQGAKPVWWVEKDNVGVGFMEDGELTPLFGTDGKEIRSMGSFGKIVTYSGKPDADGNIKLVDSLAKFVAANQPKPSTRPSVTYPEYDEAYMN